MDSNNPYQSPVDSAEPSPHDEIGFVRSRLYLVATLWAAFVLVTGFYADNGRYSWPFGVTSAAMALTSIICMAVSLRGWKHFLALPLYFFFASELLVFAILVARRYSV